MADKILLIAIFTLLFCSHATAQDFEAGLLRLNDQPPLLNPYLTSENTVLNRRLLDENYDTLGWVHDLTIDDQGRIQTLVADVDSLGFEQLMNFDMQKYNIQTNKDSYRLPLERSEIAENLPLFLSDIETASGSEAEENTTVEKLSKAPIIDEHGRQIGRVRNVLINDREDKVAALLIAIIGGQAAGRTLAIPYDSKRVVNGDRQTKVKVTDEEAETIESFADSRSR